MIDDLVRSRLAVFDLDDFDHQQVAEGHILAALVAGVSGQRLAAFFQGCGIRAHLGCLSHLVTPLSNSSAPSGAE